MKRFGEKLRMLRKRHGLTMNELAPKLGFTSQSYISEIETGKKKAFYRINYQNSSLFRRIS